MTTPLSYEELELACRLLPDYLDKRDLTSGHQWQAFAPIKQRTRHRRLTDQKIAVLERGKYGAVLLRRGPRWEEVITKWARAKRDQGVVLRLEIRMSLHALLSSMAMPVDQPQHRQKIIIRRRADTSISKGARIIQFRSQPSDESRP